jgi:hypothetical protein
VVGKNKFGAGGELEVDKIALLSAIVLFSNVPFFVCFIPVD